MWRESVQVIEKQRATQPSQSNNYTFRRKNLYQNAKPVDKKMMKKGSRQNVCQQSLLHDGKHKRKNKQHQRVTANFPNTQPELHILQKNLYI